MIKQLSKFKEILRFRKWYFATAFCNCYFSPILRPEI